MLNGVKFLFTYSWKFNKKYIIYLFGYQIVSSLLPLLIVVLPKFIIDELTGEGRIHVLIGLVGLLIGYNFIGGMLSNFLNGRMFIERGPVFSAFQAMLAERLTEADLESLEDPKFLDTASKAHRFLYANGQGFAVVLESAINIIGKIFIFIGLITIIATLNPLLVPVFAGIVIINAYMESKVRKKYTNWDLEKAPIERRTSYFIGLVQSFAFGKEMRIYNLRQWIMQKIRSHYKSSDDFYRKQTKEYQRTNYFVSFTTFIREGITYSYLIWRVLSRSIGIGDFTMYISATASFSGAMRDVMNSLLNIRQFSGYYQAVEDYLNVPRTMREGKGLPVPDGQYTIEFNNVFFKYAGQENYALKDVCMKIEPGEKIAIVGENGAGKTTFIKLLCRMYDPTRGTITLNGINIKDIDYDEYMGLFSTVFQDFKLFSFTLKENIAFSNSDEVTDDKIINILKSNGLGEKLANINNNINTHIYKDFNENGFEPSGGEGQKIALSRALYKDAPIIILDEPTAALDPRAEYDLYKRFDDLILNKTAIYISHRMSSTRFCDKVLVFVNGRIAEQGHHDDLMNANGTYTTLFSMQAQYYLNEQQEALRLA